MTARAVSLNTKAARVAPILAVAMLVAVFLLDVGLPLGYVAASLYVLPVLVAGFARSRGLVMAIAGASLGGTFLVLLFKPANELDLPASAVAFNRGCAALLIVLVAAVVSGVVARDAQVRELGTRLGDVEQGMSAERRVFEAASTISPMGPWVYQIDGDRRIAWSDEVAKVHGEKAGARPTVEEALAHYAPEERDRVRAAIRKTIDTGRPFVEEAHVLHGDDEPRPVLLMGDAVHNADGEVVRLHGLVQDVSRLRAAESSAAAQRRRFAQLIESLPIYVWTATPEGEINFFNDALTEGTGRAADELLGTSWVDTVHPSDLDRVTTEWDRAINTGEPYGLEFRVGTADGTYRWFYVSAKAELDEEGRIVTWWGSSIDVHAAHEQRERADALAHERETMLESIQDGACSVDFDWRVRYANAAAQAALDPESEGVLGRSLWDVVPWLDSTDTAAPLRAAMGKLEPVHVAHHDLETDAWFEVSVTPTSSGLTVFFRDVTPLRRLAEQLAQSQRLESVGQLTGGIAHDFNNLLTVVLGGADALTSSESLSAADHELADLIGQAARRGRDLTGRLLSFAKRQMLEPAPVDLATLLVELEPLLRRALGQHIDISLRAAPDIRPAHVDGAQLEAALVNLAVNSRDAMPAGGRLVIDVTETAINAPLAASHSDVPPGEYIVVSVSDSGEGISPEDLPRVFDPFFTTKADDKGSGLGLAMVWGFARQSGGHVAVYSEPGIGTTFRLYLPISESEVTLASPNASAPLESMRGTEHVLLVDDDALVRAFAASHLRVHGYQVVVAKSGPEALDLIATMDPPGLVFTDVIMPGGLTGPDVARAALERWPHVPVLYTSGYPDDVIAERGGPSGAVDLLTKPYTAHQLLERVRAAIDRTEALT